LAHARLAAGVKKEALALREKVIHCKGRLASFEERRLAAAKEEPEKKEKLLAELDKKGSALTKLLGHLTSEHEKKLKQQDELARLEEGGEEGEDEEGESSDSTVDPALVNDEDEDEDEDAEDGGEGGGEGGEEEQKGELERGARTWSSGQVPSHIYFCLQTLSICSRSRIVGTAFCIQPNPTSRLQ
jgi:hypothetical protein